MNKLTEQIKKSGEEFEKNEWKHWHTKSSSFERLPYSTKSLIKSHLLSSQIELLKVLRKEVEGMKSKVPKNPLPKNLNDLETLTVKRIDDCLKYAGRFNYNKGLSDFLELLINTIKENI